MPVLFPDTETTETSEVGVELQISTNKAKSKAYLISKRVIDVLIALPVLLIMLIPMGLITLLIKLESPGPAIYVHKRIGKNGAPIGLLKFRSMFVNADEMIASFSPEQKAEWEANFKLANDPRITRVGKILRKSSLDELPQLINILKGELSIVGPRPVVMEELERYGDNKDKFLSVTPGLTGYWQAYARSTCSYEQRMEMELHYAENASFWWEIKIMFATVGTVLRGKGAQ